MIRLRAPALLLAFAATAAGAATLQDFRSGIELQPEPGRAVAELSLPDAVYGGVGRADLQDLGVFNAQGTPVPHALCAAPAYGPAPQAPGEQALPVFPLQSARPPGGGSQVEVTSRDGLSVSVRSGEQAAAAPPASTEVAAYVIDARAAHAPLAALRVRWRTPDGASELHVRVEESEDLDRWQVLVPQTTLVQAGSAGQTLARERIPLPPGRRGYLRLSRIDPGPAPILDEVLAEFAAPAASTRPPLWISPLALAPQPSAPGYRFDAQRLAPMETARIDLPAPNMNLQVALQSSTAAQGPWRTVWSGPVYRLNGGEEERRSPDAAFGADSDRYWRIQVLQNADSLGSAQPVLALGYHPALLRFLAQGGAPFTLAYGSARVAQASATACDSLLQGLPQAELQSLISRNVGSGSARVLGGEAAMQPPPQPRPVRQIVLWAVLLLGAAAVAWMALSLLGRLRDRES